MGNKDTKILNKELVTISNITGSRKVIDEDGNIGVIKYFDSNLHNVLVEYDGGGSGFHCLNKGCKEENCVKGIKGDISMYDPLYYFDNEL